MTDLRGDFERGGNDQLPETISQRVAGIWFIWLLRSVSCLWFDERERQDSYADPVALLPSAISHTPFALLSTPSSPTTLPHPLQSDDYVSDFGVDSRTADH